MLALADAFAVKAFDPKRTQWVQQCSIEELRLGLVACGGRPLRYALEPGVPPATDRALVEKRDLFWSMTEPLGRYARLKLRYAYQTASLLDERWVLDLSRYVAVTVLPHLKEPNYEIHPLYLYSGADVPPRQAGRTGIAVAELESGCVVSLSTQRWSPVAHGPKETTLRLDVAGFWIDQEGRLRIGGIADAGQEAGSNPTRRLHIRQWSAFAYGTEKSFSDQAATTQQGIDLLHAIELTSVGGLSTRSNWVWPRAWVGFAGDHAVPYDDTSATARDLLASVNAWVYFGKPADFPVLNEVVNFPGFTEAFASLSGTYDLPRLRAELGEDMVRNACELFCGASELQFHGLRWFPLEYFSTPVWQPGAHDRIVLALPPEAVGRDGQMTGSIQVSMLPARGTDRERVLSRLAGETDRLAWQLTGKP